MLSSEFDDSLLGEATRNAIERIAVQVNLFAEKIPTLRIEIDGVVAEVVGNLITVKHGKKSGVRVGDRIASLREISAGTDPRKSELLPLVVELVGAATITELADLNGTAIFSGSGQVHKGDRVKSTPNPHTLSH